MSIVERAKRICLSPDAEWPVIAGESATLGSLITGYVLPLAALSAAAALVGLVAAGVGVGLALRTAVIGFVMSLVGVAVLSVIIDGLAPTFGAAKSGESAAKIAAYAPTPAWIGGLFQIIPFLGGIVTVIGGLYALYLLYLGLMRVMRSPPEKAIAYTVIVVVVAVVIELVVSFMAGAVGLGGGMRASY